MAAVRRGQANAVYGCNQALESRGRSAVVTPRRTAMSSARMLTAISAGVTAPMSRPMGECTRSRHSIGMPSSDERGANARHLGAAADQAEVLQVAGGQRPHGFEIALVPAGHDDDVGRCGDVGAMQPLGERFDDDLVLRRESGQRLANFSRSSMTCTR